MALEYIKKYEPMYGILTNNQAIKGKSDSLKSESEAQAQSINTFLESIFVESTSLGIETIKDEVKPSYYNEIEVVKNHIGTLQSACVCCIDSLLTTLVNLESKNKIYDTKISSLISAKATLSGMKKFATDEDGNKTGGYTDSYIDQRDKVIALQSEINALIGEMQEISNTANGYIKQINDLNNLVAGVETDAPIPNFGTLFELEEVYSEAVELPRGLGFIDEDRLKTELPKELQGASNAEKELYFARIDQMIAHAKSGNTAYLYVVDGNGTGKDYVFDNCDKNITYKRYTSNGKEVENPKITSLAIAYFHQNMLETTFTEKNATKPEDFISITAQITCASNIVSLEYGHASEYISSAKGLIPTYVSGQGTCYSTAINSIAQWIHYGTPHLNNNERETLHVLLRDAGWNSVNSVFASISSGYSKNDFYSSRFNPSANVGNILFKDGHVGVSGGVVAYDSTFYDNRNGWGVTTSDRFKYTVTPEQIARWMESETGINPYPPASYC